MQLLNGDCYKLISDIPDNSIDLVITDPPYEFNAQITGRGMFSDKNAERYHRKRAVAMLNELETLDSTTFKPELFLELIKPKLKRFYGYFFCNKTLVPDYLNWAIKNNYSYDILVMNKTNPVPAHSTHHVSDLEYIVLIRHKGGGISKVRGLLLMIIKSFSVQFVKGDYIRQKNLLNYWSGLYVFLALKTVLFLIRLWEVEAQDLQRLKTVVSLSALKRILNILMSQESGLMNITV